mmetsp:Transcript_74555/g.218365  ORF Transcript_74555/g.218365 Transcript_74555/m.218365 type:complete len:258 (-) Transcript_74555:2-775(-)
MPGLSSAVKKLSAPASFSTFFPRFFFCLARVSRTMRGVDEGPSSSPSWPSWKKPEICFLSSWPFSATCFPSSLGVIPSWPGGMRSFVAAWIVDQPSVSCCLRRCAAGLSSKLRGSTGFSALPISISPPMFSLTGPESSRGLIVSQRRATYSTGPSPSRRGSTRLLELMLSFLSSFIMKSMVLSRCSFSSCSSFCSASASTSASSRQPLLRPTRASISRSSSSLRPARTSVMADASILICFVPVAGPRGAFAGPKGTA